MRENLLKIIHTVVSGCRNHHVVNAMRWESGALPPRDEVKGSSFAVKSSGWQMPVPQEALGNAGDSLRVRSQTKTEYTCPYVPKVAEDKII